MNLLDKSKLPGLLSKILDFENFDYFLKHIHNSKAKLFQIIICI